MDYLNETAKALGLSKSTVARALAHSKPIKFTTEKQVIDYVSLHFPEYLEKRLRLQNTRTGSSKVITVALPYKPAFFWEEAAAGVDKALHSNPALSSFVSLRYIYYSGAFSEKELIPILKKIHPDNTDALAVVPVCTPAVTELIQKISLELPVVQINEYCSYENCCAIITDGVNEGKRAAEMALSFVQDDDIVMVLSQPSYPSKIIENRLNAFRAELHSLRKDCRIIECHIENVASVYDERYLYNTSLPSIVARSIRDAQIGDRHPAVIYDPHGYLYPCFLAGRKLGFSKTAIIGHEITSKMREKFEDGCKGGYIRQDIFSQGFRATSLLIDYLVYGRKIPEGLFPVKFDSALYK